MNLSRVDSSNINNSGTYEPNSTGPLLKKYSHKDNESYHTRSKSRGASSEKINTAASKISIPKFATPEAKKYNYNIDSI